ncbi:ACBP domain-containing protein [Cephalotus follicularis]|uniref:ACBP domain-containing protein n=1 Tax=Cephalotus follicularis TaxID=3775 RepID=A0A1Q3BDP9_CEPFO|nr:ACBP domain-containing protein [Cephalotus follicularis]
MDQLFIHELFWTAVMAAVFSFLVFKLVSMATCGGDCGSHSHSDSNSKNDVTMEELQWRQNLEVDSFQTQNRVQFAQGTVANFHEFDLKTVELPEFTESKNVAQEMVKECCQKKEGELNKVVELAGKSEVMVEKEAMIDDNEVIAEFEEEKRVVESESNIRDEEVVDIDDEEEEEEEDWEGIERSELEKLFAEAAKSVDNLESGSLGSDLHMELYGLHKVATEGPCRQPQPMALMVSARAKWNAWQRLGNMSPDVAMERYVDLLSDKVPKWMEDNSIGDSKMESPDAGISSTLDPDLSTFSPYHPKFTDERNPEPEPCVKGVDVTGGSSLENKAKE